MLWCWYVFFSVIFLYTLICLVCISLFAVPQIDPICDYFCGFVLAFPIHLYALFPKSSPTLNLLTFQDSVKIFLCEHFSLPYSWKSSLPLTKTWWPSQGIDHTCLVPWEFSFLFPRLSAHWSMDCVCFILVTIMGPGNLQFSLIP